MCEGVDGGIFDIYCYHKIRCQLRQESEYVKVQVENKELTFGYSQEAEQNNDISMPMTNIIMNIAN